MVRQVLSKVGFKLKSDERKLKSVGIGSDLCVIGFRLGSIGFNWDRIGCN